MGGNRFIAPAAAFSLVGLLVALLAPLDYFRLEGGLVTTGCYTAALQVVSTLFGLAVIDDFRDPQVLSSGKFRRLAPAAGRRPSAQAKFNTRRALVRFYLRMPVPASLLAFGVAVTVSMVAIGLFDHGGPGLLFGSLGVQPSELMLGGVLLVTALPQLWKYGLGYFGWCAGMAAGAAIVQIQFSAHVSVPTTLLGWLVAALALCLVGAAVKIFAALLHRKANTTPGDVA